MPRTKKGKKVGDVDKLGKVLSLNSLTKGLSWKRREVCSLLQAAETQDLPNVG